MTLRLNGLSVSCVIGERADERTHPQHLRIDASLEVDARVADSDELSDAVDYAALAEAIRETLTAAQCQMIERAAKLAAERCLCEPSVRAATVSVTKAGAVAGLESATAVFTAEKGGPSC